MTKRYWILGFTAAAMLAVPAVFAQPRTESLAMSIPSSAKALAGDLPAAGTPVPGAMDAAKVREAIEAANAKWLEAFRSGDSASLARIYAPDASLFPPSNVSLEGRDRIVDYFGAQRRAGMGEASLKTLDVVCVGDVAYEVGMYGFRFERSDAAAASAGDAAGGTSGDAGRYFAIWKAQDDGSWRYQVGIWSSNRDTQPKP